MVDIPTSEPTEIAAGDLATWKITDSDFPASDSWVLTYALVKSGTLIEITASADGDDHLVEVASATTASWAAGTYQYQGYFTLSGERYLRRQGTIEVLPNFAAQSSGYDPRSHVKTVLDAIEALLEGRATKDQEGIVINGLVIGKMPIHRLIEWRDRYRGYYEAEQQAEAVAKGEGHGGNILVRFTDE